MKLISKKVKIEPSFKNIESEEDFSDLFNDSNVRDGVLYLTHLNFINEEILRNRCQCYKYFYQISKSVHTINVTDWKFPYNNKELILKRTFANLPDIKYITGLETWDISNVTRLVSVFKNCFELRKINLSGWNPETLESMFMMFCDCHRLEEITGLEKWELRESEYWEFEDCFKNCEKLKIDLSHWPILDRSMLTAFEGTNPKLCKLPKGI